MTAPRGQGRKREQMMQCNGKVKTSGTWRGVTWMRKHKGDEDEVVKWGIFNIMGLFNILWRRAMESLRKLGSHGVSGSHSDRQIDSYGIRDQSGMVKEVLILHKRIYEGNTRGFRQGGHYRRKGMWAPVLSCGCLISMLLCNTQR